MTARYCVHKLIQDLVKNPAEAGRFAEDSEAFFDAYGLSPREKELLRDGSRQALGELGVHPNLQMKYARLRSTAPAPSTGAAPGGPLAAYLDRLLERR
jgi:hypothetical protein